MRLKSAIGFGLFWIMTIVVVQIIDTNNCDGAAKFLRHATAPQRTPESLQSFAPEELQILEDVLGAHIARAKDVLQHPGAVDHRPADHENKPFYYVLPPELLGIPVHQQESAETYFEQVLLPRVLPENGKQFVVDVGANAGQFAVAMVKAGVDGVSFEPSPATCAKLKANIAEQGNGGGHVRVVCAAVGASEGSINFDMPNTVESTSFRKVEVANEHSVKVPVITLDSEVGDGQSILLLKTDTQGFEMDVLAGAKRLLRNKVPRLLLVELSHYLLNKAGSSTLKLMEFIAQCGYVCTHLTFHGPKKEKGFGLKTTPDQFRRPLAFSEMASLLKHFPPEGKPAWTDLLCW